MKTKILCILFLGWTLGLGAIGCAKEELNPKRWEETIIAFEKQDQEAPPPENGILFLGSSTIRKWDLEKWFPKLPTINRGFGGSHIADSLYYAKRIVIPYQPRAIVFYAGDNDINVGKSPQQVFSDFKKFVNKIHDSLQETRILFIAIKPSISRWDKVNPMRQANEMIQTYCRKHPRLFYVDIDTPMIGEDGKPKEQLFLEDGLHLNQKGYRLWTQKIRPFLKNKDDEALHDF